MVCGQPEALALRLYPTGYPTYYVGYPVGWPIEQVYL